MITIYDKVTGDILRTILCPESMYEIQCSNNEDFILGEYNEIEYKINITTKEPELI